MELVFDKLPTLPTQSEGEVPAIEANSKTFKIATYSTEKIAQFRKEFAKNEFLFLFENQLTQMENDSKAVPDSTIDKTKEFDAKNMIYQRLKQTITTTFILPFKQYFCSTLTNLLNARISVANDYVLQIYKNEHQIVHHLQNLPKVYFLEAGDLMSDFYSKLFTQVSYLKHNFALTLTICGIPD